MTILKDVLQYALKMKRFYEAPNPEIDAIIEDLKSQRAESDLIDWEQRRFELAKEAMQKVLSLDGEESYKSQ